MPFKDYSLNPSANTEIGDGLFIGPNMDRNNVRPALQQLAADGRDLYTAVQGLEIEADRAVEASTAAVAAAAIAESALDRQYYGTVAEGEVATATGDIFTVAKAGGAYDLYRRTAGGSEKLASYYGAPSGFLIQEGAGGAVSVPYYIAITDVFVIVGQSNAEGRGQSGTASPATVATEIEQDGTLTYPLADPVGNAIGGSMWPAFVNEWTAGTDNACAVIEAALGGTALLAAADGGTGNWSPTGTLRAAAVANALTAINAIDNSPLHRLGSVYFVWCQGESDAAALDAGTAGVTGANYTAGLVALASYFKAQVPRMNKMLVVRTGSRNDRDGALGWAGIRAAQEAACAQTSLLQMGYRGATSFPLDGRNIHFDQLHWNRDALAIAGKCTARAGYRGTDPIKPAAPAIVGSQFFLDTDTTTATTRTDSHTVAAGARALVVGVVAVRTSSNSVNVTTGVTFGGVALTKLASQGGVTSTADTSSLGRVDTSLWLLTETAYGGPLAGATGDIVVTQPLATNLLSAGVFNLDAEPVIETAPFATRLSGNAGTSYTGGYTAAPGDGLTTGAASTVLAVIGTVGDGAAAIGHTFTGLIEDADGGGSTGTRAAQAAFAHASVGEVTQQAISVASASATGGAFIAVALRGKVDGE